MLFANRYVRTLKPYIPISHKIWELSHKENILKLDWNESTLPPSPLVRQALMDFLDNGYLQWYPNTHNAELYVLLSQYAKVDSRQIEIFAGSDCAHEFILQVFADPESKVLIISPTYDNFRARAQGVGIYTHFFSLDVGFELSFERLRNKILTHKPQMVYICNPNNPTGKAYDNKQLETLVQAHKDVMFVIDEAYYEFYGRTLAHLTGTIKNLIITRTFSKAFALANLRIGYCISNVENIAYINKLRNPKSISTIAQIAAINALKDVNYMQSYAKEVISTREWFIAQLRGLGITAYDSNANFVLIACQRDLYATLEKHHIYIRDYRHIIPNHFRITIGTQRQMQRVLSILKEII